MVHGEKGLCLWVSHVNRKIIWKASSRPPPPEQISPFDVAQVRNCRLVGLPDLRVGSGYVRGKIAGYFNDLISLGVAGIRIDAAKHMWPGDIGAILGMTHNLNTEHGFRPGARLFVYQVGAVASCRDPQIRSTWWEVVGSHSLFIVFLIHFIESTHSLG